jgi:hypothetical protein
MCGRCDKERLVMTLSAERQALGDMLQYRLLNNAVEGLATGGLMTTYITSRPSYSKRALATCNGRMAV